MNEILKKEWYEEETEGMPLIDEKCEECAYRGEKGRCKLYCRFLDAKKSCRCFHQAKEPFEACKIRKTVDIEQRLLRAETPEFSEVKMIWLSDMVISVDPLFYNLYDMGNILKLERYETEIFMLRNCRKSVLVQMRVPQKDGGPEDWYMTADGVRQMALDGLLKREKEDNIFWFYEEWEWISRTYLKWMPRRAACFFCGQSLLDV